eukprot:TRINITY_DN2619_c0_g1_i6.p1 TRINITY_DN2619_c0_g1~~TRINITY_DN2619_c0_g1_i6.p1  ORF type:complete len:327 (+),score=11.59 TRINITY_DN2619_c0_g1_i6:183-1163(+)
MGFEKVCKGSQIITEDYLELLFINKFTLPHMWRTKCLELLSSQQTECLTKKQIFALLLGQVVSLLVTGTGVTSQYLVTLHQVNIPTTQSLFNYILVMIVYGIMLARKGKYFSTLFSKDKIKFYLPLALIDVEANFLLVMSYQYTTIASVMLLDCFAIPCAVVLTYFIIKTKYNLRHLIGVVICVCGLGALVYSDFVDSEGAQNRLLGDMLCLAGAFLYALSNVGAEAFSKTYSNVEYLAMVGFWGSIISAIQVAIVDRENLASMNWNWDVISLLLGFTACLFLVYSYIPFVLVLGGATLFNLSLLSSDLFAILSAVFLFHNQVFYE